MNMAGTLAFADEGSILRCRTPLLYNRHGGKSVSPKEFFENAIAAIKSFFPAVSRVSLFWAKKIPKVAYSRQTDIAFGNTGRIHPKFEPVGW
jgi:hypothetical protein